MEFGRKWSEDKTERKTQGAVAAVEYNPADSCAAVRVDIVIGNRLGDIPIPARSGNQRKYGKY